jgi:uncharacterized protein YndB with AHSA1/START domain
VSPVGKTADAGWQIGVSCTVRRPVGLVWDTLVSDPGVATWLGRGVSFPVDVRDRYETVDGTVGQVRSFRPGDRVRLTWQPEGWDHETTLQVAVVATRTGTSIRFHQERLAGPDERERQRVHWRGVLDRFEGLLDR